MEQQSILRRLAKDYAIGQIDKEKYRNSRTKFLESVLSGEEILPVTGHSPLAENENFNDITSQKSERPEIASEPIASVPATDNDILKNKSTLLYGGIGLVVAIVLIIAIFASGDDESISQSQSPQENQNTAISNAPPSAAQNLISKFLVDNNWSQSNQDIFLMNWRGISESERASATTSTEFGRLINAINKKLLEERALSLIGNPETSYEKQHLLVDFATTIGISDQRISLPDAPTINGQ
jgi:hypothetical protein